MQRRNIGKQQGTVTLNGAVGGGKNIQGGGLYTNTLNSKLSKLLSKTFSVCGAIACSINNTTNRTIPCPSVSVDKGNKRSSLVEQSNPRSTSGCFCVALNYPPLIINCQSDKVS